MMEENVMNRDEQDRIKNELQNRLRQGRISRRQFLKLTALTGLGLSGASVLAACAPPATTAPTVAPTAAAVQPTTAAAQPTAPAAGRPLTPRFTNGSWTCTLACQTST